MKRKTDWFKVEIISIIFALFALAAVFSVHIGQQAYRGSHKGTEILVEKPSGKVNFSYVRGARVAFRN
jgi:hypothetical protein